MTQSATSLFHQWCGSNAFYRPAAIDATVDDWRAETDLMREFRYGHSPVVVLYHVVVGLVVCLFGGGSPTAIVGRVAQSIVDAIYRVQRGWSAAHIGKEIREVMPAFADCDSVTTIRQIPFFVWILATLDHSCPGVVLLCSSCDSGIIAMLPACRARSFDLIAAAAITFARNQVSPAHGSFRSAIATAKPECRFGLVANWSFAQANNRPSVEFLAGYILNSVWSACLEIVHNVSRLAIANIHILTDSLYQTLSTLTNTLHGKFSTYASNTFSGYVAA